MLRTAGVFLVGVGKTVGKVDREYEGEDKTGAPRGKLADRVFIPSMRDLRSRLLRSPFSYIGCNTIKLKATKL